MNFLKHNRYSKTTNVHYAVFLCDFSSLSWVNKILGGNTSLFKIVFLFKIVLTYLKQLWDIKRPSF